MTECISKSLIGNPCRCCERDSLRSSGYAFDVEAFERDRGFWLSKPSRLRDDVVAMLAEIRRLRALDGGRK